MGCVRGDGHARRHRVVGVRRAERFLSPGERVVDLGCGTGVPAGLQHEVNAKVSENIAIMSLPTFIIRQLWLATLLNMVPE